MTSISELSAIDDSLVEIQDTIRDFFDWDIQDDITSALALIEAVENYPIDSWSRHQRSANLANLRRRLVLRDQKIAVLGAAISEEDVIEILRQPTLLVGADGAVGVLSNLPDSIRERAWSRLACVVSDADGGAGTFEAAKRGIPFILHAHGDNITAWGDFLSHAASTPTPSPLILTHQTREKIPGMHNPGGFTDGDRAACILMSLGVPLSNIEMLGTRIDVVGEWSGTTDSERKMVKLQWMAKVLEALEIDF